MPRAVATGDSNALVEVFITMLQTIKRETADFGTTKDPRHLLPSL
jgi:hypothetical protein